MALLGIDISAHQGDIDLQTLKNNGVQFVIIRVGYGTNGTIDTKFKRNADLCRQLGIPVGFYWYSYALNIEGCRREALACLNAIEPYRDICKFGVWFDMEDADGYKRRNGMPSNETLRQMCAMFCKIIEENGFYAGIYASQSWFNNQLNGDEIKPYDRWVAAWPTSGGRQKALNTDPNSKSGVNMWQFTSAAKISGYGGNLDADYAYLDNFPNPGQTNNSNTQQPVDNTPQGSTLDLVYRVMKGEFGDGDNRRNNLGSRYNEVQDFINHIYSASVNTLVGEVMDRKYGDGEIRKTVLGSRYNEVQNVINNGYEKYYTVKSGDTLSGIGSRLGVNWRDIANKNGISSPYTIYPGQKLKY